MIAIINYHIGNLQSVANLLDYLKEPCVITNNPTEISSADKLILPGVGAFTEAMNNLRELKLVEVIRREVLDFHKPFLGICLGMQLMANKGYEGGETSGLGLIPGEVVRMKLVDSKLPLPHVGWNDVKPKAGTTLYGADIRPRVYYFVHSYHFKAARPEDVSGTCDYGGEFIASIERDNIFSTQFHPEKSQQDGIELLKNFLAYKTIQ